MYYHRKIEEKDERFICFEIKFNARKRKNIPADFMKEYSNTTFKVITPENFYELMEFYE